MKIAVVTGSRSEYGILRPVIDALARDAFFELSVLVTGSHLSPEFGMTVRQIEADDVAICARVEMLLSSDSGIGMAKALGLGVIGFADALASLQPDCVLLLGDRFEIFAVAQACLMLRIPVVHVGGGDATEGAIDDAMRHAITKMSHLHLVTHAEAARRVVQMGEEPGRVVVVGNPGLDGMVAAVPTPAEMAQAGFACSPRDLLVLLHPETLCHLPSTQMAAQMTQALEQRDPASAVWLVLANADAQGREMTTFLQQWAGGKSWVHVHASVPRRWFLGLMAHCAAMVGNSSSALTEAPSLGTAAVDIGARQAGRLAGASVIHVPASAKAIAVAIGQAIGKKTQAFPNPYGDGQASERIVAALKAAGPARDWLYKRFHVVLGADI